MGVRPREVYDALLALLRFRRGREATSADAAAAPDAAPPAPPPRCPHCGARGGVRLDAREGVRGCEACGAVLDLRPGNVEREYDAPAELDAACRRRLGEAPKGVPRWLLERSAAYTVADPHERRSAHWRDLEHWNAFARLPADDLARADRMLREWSDGGREARLAAVLLWPRLQLPDEHAFRAAVRRGAPPAFATDVAPPRFACADCGAPAHTAKEARVHCAIAARWGRKRRRL
jgi:hypothetical protein